MGQEWVQFTYVCAYSGTSLCLAGGPWGLSKLLPHGRCLTLMKSSPVEPFDWERALASVFLSGISAKHEWSSGPQTQAA